MQQVHAHDRVARVDQRVIHRVIGRRARKRLYVDKDIIGRDAIRGKSLGATPARQRFDDVGVFDAFVIARVRITAEMAKLGGVIHDFGFTHLACIFIRVPFSVDILERRCQRLAHCQGRLAFAGDQDQLASLAFCFQLGQSKDGWVQIGQRTAKEKVCHNLLLSIKVRR